MQELAHLCPFCAHQARCRLSHLHGSAPPSQSQLSPSPVQASWLRAIMHSSFSGMQHALCPQLNGKQKPSTSLHALVSVSTAQAWHARQQAADLIRGSISVSQMPTQTVCYNTLLCSVAGRQTSGCLSAEAFTSTNVCPCQTMRLAEYTHRKNDSTGTSERLFGERGEPVLLEAGKVW